MKPLVVLGLVLVAVAALVTALLRALGDSSGEETVLPGGTQSSSVTPEPRAARDLKSGPAEQAGGREVAPTVVTPASTDREVVAVAAGNQNYYNKLRGHVLDPESKPLEGARVKLIQRRVPAHLQMIRYAVADTPFNESFRKTTSAADGSYSFVSMEPASDYAVLVEHPDYSRTEEQNIQITEAGEHIVDVRMKAGLVCMGYVHDGGGNPIAGAALTLVNQFEAALPGEYPHSDRLETQTDDTGAFRFGNVPAGNRNLTASAPGFGAKTRNNLIFLDETPNPVTADFRLEPGLMIAGRVVAPDRTGLVGATVEAISYHTAMSSRGRSASQKNGEFAIENLTEGEYTLIVRADGYREERVSRVEGGDTTVQVEMALLGGIMGQVVALSNGKPLSSFRLGVRQVNPGAAIFGRPFINRSFENAENGEFEIAGLDSGTYVVQGAAPGYAPTFSDTFTVTQGIVTPDIVVRMSQGGRITGRIVDASREPVANAVIATFDNGYIENPFTQMLGGVIPRMTADKQARTDTDGFFALEGLNPEVYQLQITNPEHTTKTVLDRRVADGATDDLGTVVLRRGAILRGTVYDGAGQPLPGSEINLNGNAIGTRPGPTYRARSGQDGRYEIRNVSEGSYKLTATRGGDTGNPFVKILDMKNSEVSMNLVEGATQVQDLYLGDN